MTAQSIWDSVKTVLRGSSYQYKPFSRETSNKQPYFMFIVTRKRRKGESQS